MLTHERRILPAVLAPFVDVVAGVEHEVELLGGNPAVGGEVAGLVVAAAAHRKSQTIHVGAGRGSRLRAPNRTDLAADAKAVEVFTAGCQTARLDAHAVTELRTRHRDTLGRRHRERAVLRDLPADFDIGHRHPAAGERLRRETRPEDDAVGRRFAGRDTERERIGPEDRLREGPSRPPSAAERQRGRVSTPR